MFEDMRISSIRCRIKNWSKQILKKHSMYKTYHNIIQQQSDGAVLAWTWTLF